MTAGLKWMKCYSNRLVSNVSLVQKPIWRGLSISWQDSWIILGTTNSEKLLVFLVLLYLFISKIAGYNQEYLLPRYWYSFQDWIPWRVLKHCLENRVDLFEQLFGFVCACLFICIFHSLSWLVIKMKFSEVKQLVDIF